MSQETGRKEDDDAKLKRLRREYNRLCGETSELHEKINRIMQQIRNIEVRRW